MASKKEKEQRGAAIDSYLRSREKGDFTYLCNQTTYLLGIEDFLINLEEKDGYPLEAEFTISKKDVETNVFVTLFNSNVTIKSSFGVVLGKFKFNPLVASQVAGAIFGEWLKELSETL